MNILYNFERGVIQTFRIWNWLLYFLLGALVKEVGLINIRVSATIRTLMIVLSIGCYIIFQKLSVPAHMGIEYFFGSSAHMAFSFIMFVAIASVNIPSSHIIEWLSTLFLPVYAFHQFVIYFLTKYSLIGVNSAGVASPFVNFMIVATITIAISAVVMKIPYLNKIFRI